MRRLVEVVLNLFALILLPFVGLAAAAHQAEEQARAVGLLYAFATAIAFVQLARLLWAARKEKRLHSARY